MDQLRDNQLIPYIGSEIRDIEIPADVRRLAKERMLKEEIDGCKDRDVEIPADCDGAILKKEIEDKMRADNPEGLCLTKINNKL